MSFLEEKIKMYPDFRDVKDWAVRLSKLNSTGQVKTTPIAPTDILPQKASNPTLGKKISEFKKSMPEFNFYFDMPEGSDPLAYNHNVTLGLFNKLRQYREAFETIKSLAKIAENEGDYKKAIEDFNKFIELKPDDVYSYFCRGVAYSKLGNYNKAVEDYSKAIDIYPQIAFLYNKRGIAYEKIGEQQGQHRVVALRSHAISTSTLEYF